MSHGERRDGDGDRSRRQRAQGTRGPLDSPDSPADEHGGVGVGRTSPPILMLEDEPVTSYQRPSIDVTVFRDAAGEVIDYGDRWGGEMPPEDTYSVDTHPERFAPIHAVADALIAHLRAAYDVDVDEGDEVAADLLHAAREVKRAVRIRPRDAASASLTFVFTDYPGVFVHAGLLHDFHFPVCGCDACDSTWEAEADELERRVLAVVGGHYREHVGPGFHPWVGHSITFPDGSASGQSPGRELPADRVRAAARALRQLPDGWAPWPLKHADS